MPQSRNDHKKQALNIKNSSGSCRWSSNCNKSMDLKINLPINLPSNGSMEYKQNFGSIQSTNPDTKLNTKRNNA